MTSTVAGAGLGEIVGTILLITYCVCICPLLPGLCLSYIVIYGINTEIILALFALNITLVYTLCAMYFLKKSA